MVGCGYALVVVELAECEYVPGVVELGGCEYGVAAAEEAQNLGPDLEVQNLDRDRDGAFCVDPFSLDFIKAFLKIKLLLLKLRDL